MQMQDTFHQLETTRNDESFVPSNDKKKLCFNAGCARMASTF
jgi:hypothetical protein